MDRPNFKIAALFCAFLAFGSFAQDTLDIEGVDIIDKRTGFKKIGLYDGVYEDEYNVRGFTQLSVFSGSLGDYWTSEGGDCITGKLTDDGVSKNLRVKWNKDQSGCDWVGMGIGWDSWTGKDMGYVIDTLALELVVRSVDKPFTNIPWAFCFEDYSGGQAWLGYNLSFLQSDAITTEWTKVQIPLDMFPFEENEVDATNIKQLMMQVFAEGEIEIQSINLIPYVGKQKKQVVASTGAVNVDGQLTDWSNEFAAFDKDQEFAMRYTKEMVYFAFKVKDDSPRENGKIGSELWNGDAIEIAFSTNPKVDDKRKFLMLSDQHLGINCGKNPYVWNWKTNEIIANATVAFGSMKGGYTVEVAIPTALFKNFIPEQGQQLDVEVAFDLGTETGREQQVRWNSGKEEGFHLSPQKWGVLLLQ